MMLILLTSITKFQTKYMITELPACYQILPKICKTLAKAHVGLLSTNPR